MNFKSHQNISSAKLVLRPTNTVKAPPRKIRRLAPKSNYIWSNSNPQPNITVPQNILTGFRLAKAPATLVSQNALSTISSPAMTQVHNNAENKIFFPSNHVVNVLPKSVSTHSGSSSAILLPARTNTQVSSQLNDSSGKLSLPSTSKGYCILVKSGTTSQENKKFNSVTNPPTGTKFVRSSIETPFHNHSQEHPLSISSEAINHVIGTVPLQSKDPTDTFLLSSSSQPHFNAASLGKSSCQPTSKQTGTRNKRKAETDGMEDCAQTLKELQEMTDNGISVKAKDKRGGNQELTLSDVVQEIRMCRNKVNMVCRLLQANNSSIQNIEESFPLKFPLKSGKEVIECENLINSDATKKDNLLVYLTDKLKLTHEPDAENRVDKVLEHIMDDEVFHEIGWSSVHNRKKNRINGKGLKLFNGFLKDLVQSTAKKVKDRVSHYADLARRRTGERKKKEDCQPLLENESGFI